MPIRKYKPTSPGRRFMTVSTFEEVTKTEPEKSLLEPLKRKGGRNNQGRITTRHQGGGHKRRYRVIDFKRTRTACRRRWPRSSTTRTGRPASRCSTTPTARSATSSPRRGCASATTRRVRPGGRHQARQRAAAGEHPDRHARAQHRAEARPRRAARPLRGRERAARGEGGLVRDAAPPVRRNAPRPADMSRYHRAGRQRRPRERLGRQGRPEPLAGQAPAPCAARR